MKVTYDSVKSLRNIATRGLAFDLVNSFEWDSSFILEDTRKDYGEQRFIAIGLIDQALYVTVFTPRIGNIHVISLRRANLRERKKYAAQTQPSES